MSSCWGNQDDVQALYATVDLSKKCHRNTNPNYANIDVPQQMNPTTSNNNASSNYENMDFAQSLQLYENGKQVREPFPGFGLNTHVHSRNKNDQGS